MLNYYAYLFAVSISVCILSYIFWKYIGKSLKGQQQCLKDKTKSRKVAEGIRRKAIPSIINRQKIRTETRMKIDEDLEDSADESIQKKDMSENIEKKIGVKKARKLEEKKIKKEAREQEERERVIKKKLDDENAEKDKMIKEEEEKAALIKEAELESERLEKEKKEQEFYEKIKADFEIEDEGIEDLESKLRVEQKLDADIKDYLINNKVVMIEELSGYFNLKTQVCVEKIKNYLKCGDLTGVIDDRGKFIHINMGEYMKVKKFIIQRGRINIKELVENSNKLIRLC